jgi:hypothetical protein
MYAVGTFRWRRTIPPEIVSSTCSNSTFPHNNKSNTVLQLLPYANPTTTDQAEATRKRAGASSVNGKYFGTAHEVVFVPARSVTEGVQYHLPYQRAGGTQVKRISRVEHVDSQSVP